MAEKKFLYVRTIWFLSQNNEINHCFKIKLNVTSRKAILLDQNVEAALLLPNVQRSHSTFFLQKEKALKILSHYDRKHLNSLLKKEENRTENCRNGQINFVQRKIKIGVSLQPLLAILDNQENWNATTLWLIKRSTFSHK